MYVDQLNGEWYKPQPYGFPAFFMSDDIRLIRDEVRERPEEDVVEIVYGSDQMDQCGCYYWFSSKLIPEMRYNAAYTATKVEMLLLTAADKIRRHREQEHRLTPAPEIITANGTNEVVEWQNN